MTVLRDGWHRRVGKERMMGSDRPLQRVWSATLAHTITRPVIAVVMGVSGLGKTTVSALLAAALGCISRRMVWSRSSGGRLDEAARVPEAVSAWVKANIG
jgi:replication-associated recombination protein RarA